MGGIRHAELETRKEDKNRGGGTFRCLRKTADDTYYMQNTKSLWLFEAHVITLYEDGSIEWDYSTDGHFTLYEA